MELLGITCLCIHSLSLVISPLKMGQQTASNLKPVFSRLTNSFMAFVERISSLGGKLAGNTCVAKMALAKLRRNGGAKAQRSQTGPCNII